MLSFQAPASSDRLTLRPFSPADLDDVSLFQSDPLVLPFIPWTRRSRQETLDWLERQADSEVRAEGESGTWAVVRRSDFFFAAAAARSRNTMFCPM